MSVEETGSLELFEGKQQEITRQELVERVSEHVNRILRRNLYELKLDEKQTPITGSAHTDTAASSATDLPVSVSPHR